MSIFDLIGQILLNLRSQGVEEVDDSAELAAAVRNQPRGAEAVYIYSTEGRPRPYLVSSYREEGLVAMAFLDLDDVRLIKIDTSIDDLETKSTTEVGEGKYAFVAPLAAREEGLYVAVGVKTVVEEEMLLGGYIDQLIDDFEDNRDHYFNEVLDSLKTHTGAQTHKPPRA